MSSLLSGQLFFSELKEGKLSKCNDVKVMVTSGDFVLLARNASISRQRQEKALFSTKAAPIFCRIGVDVVELPECKGYDGVCCV